MFTETSIAQKDGATDKTAPAASEIVWTTVCVCRNFPHLSGLTDSGNLIELLICHNHKRELKAHAELITKARQKLHAKS